MSKNFDTSIEVNKHRVIRRFLTWTILLLGIFLIIGTFLDFSAFSQLQAWRTDIHKFTEAIFYSCIGFICIVLGLERALDIGRIDNTLKIQVKILRDIENYLKSFRQFRYLEENEDIYVASIKLIEKTETKMRALIYANQPKAPEWWNEKIASILKEKSEKGKPIQFDIVICVKPSDLSIDFFKIADARFEIYTQKGVSNYFHRYIHEMKKTIGHDCLIIDDKHFIINFPTIQTNSTQKGLLFENQPVVTRELLNWYDSFVFTDFIPYDELKRDFTKKQIKKNNSNQLPE